MTKEEVIKEIEEILKTSINDLNTAEDCAYRLGYMRASLEHLFEKLKKAN